MSELTLVHSQFNKWLTSNEILKLRTISKYVMNGRDMREGITVISMTVDYATKQEINVTYRGIKGDDTSTVYVQQAEFTRTPLTLIEETIL